MTDVKDNKKWFAIYVKSRSEKKVLKLLEDIGVESFLPLITRVKQWSDRKKKVEEPLFRSYLFVNIPLNDYYTVLNVNGVVKFITFEKKPVPVPENQIIAIKEYLNDTELHSINYEDFKEGELVRVKTGQMKDLVGRFVKINGKHRVIIDIEAVGQSLAVNVARSNVEAVK
ncbi:MAG: UpxY family transcription antiterminator [Bacteroidales bacterium]|nr:UpxY family transcription antiterminator [Bacteroidales bacterium]